MPTQENSWRRLKPPQSYHPVQGVNAAFTPAAGMLPRVKGQSNQLPLAESGAKSSAHTASVAAHSFL